MMRPLPLAAAALFLVAWQQPTFRTRTELVRVDTLVTRAGVPVTGLTAADFDVRDQGRRERLEAVAGDAGCHACHTHLACGERCPKNIVPTAAIAGLKRAVALAVWKGEL